MKTYKFSKAKLNVVQYNEPSEKEYASSLVLDETLSGFVNKYGLHKTIFEGVNGRYLCTSAIQEPFISNPFGVNMNSVSQVSCCLKDLLKNSDYSLIGWTLLDTHQGYFTLSVELCDRHYEMEFGILPDIKLNSFSLEVMDEGFVRRYYEDSLDYISSAIRSVLLSLNGVTLPIDLLEVSLIGAKYSEESYDSEDYETCVWEKMGEFTNTSHVLNGLSVIHKKNGFDLFGDLSGKYAMVVVV